MDRDVLDVQGRYFKHFKRIMLFSLRLILSLKNLNVDQMVWLLKYQPLPIKDFTNFQAPPGEPGELLFFVDPEGTNDAGKAFQGYYGNSAATNKKIARSVLKKDDYFFRTGDVLKYVYDGARRYTHFEDRIGD